MTSWARLLLVVAFAGAGVIGGAGPALACTASPKCSGPPPPAPSINCPPPNPKVVAVLGDPSDC